MYIPIWLLIIIVTLFLKMWADIRTLMVENEILQEDLAEYENLSCE